MLQVLKHPDERLRTIAEKVTLFDAELEKLISEMLNIIYTHDGIGLAATQVDVHKRIFVMDVTEAQNNPVVFINPSIIKKLGVRKMEEGCLSVPRMKKKIQRAKHIKVDFLDRTGKHCRVNFRGLPATCIQHEMDHLAGKLIVDY